MSAESHRGIGPVGIAPYLAHVEDGFARRTRELTEAARRVRVGADAKAIHDLRVATRRLTAAFRAWEGLVPARAGEAACRALRRMRRRLGEARELEVHVALVEGLRPGDGDHGRTVVDTILEELRERLARRRRAAMKRASPRRLKRLLGRIEAATSGLAERASDHAAAAADALAVERQVAERATVALRWTAARPDEISLHETRIRVKQWRYLLECLQEALPDVRWRAAQPLRRLQTLLGEIHDRGLLRDLFARYALEPLSEPDREHLNVLIGSLDEERARAVRRFRRRAVAGIAAWAAEPEAAELLEALRPPADAPEERAAPPEPGPVIEVDDEEQRLSRMASWLERGRGRS